VGDLKESLQAGWKRRREQKAEKAQVLWTVLQTAKEDLTRADLRTGQRTGQRQRVQRREKEWK
jgi:hypothetical protein